MAYRVEKAHQFADEQAANAAVQQINEGEGIGQTEANKTETYTNPFEQGGTWYVYADDITCKYLGAPIDLEIPEPEIEQ